MTGGLDPVVQEFIANTAPYVDALQEAIDKAQEFAAASSAAADEVARLQEAMDRMGAAGAAAAAGTERAANASRDAARATAQQVIAQQAAIETSARLALTEGYLARGGRDLALTSQSAVIAFAALAMAMGHTADSSGHLGLAEAFLADTDNALTRTKYAAAFSLAALSAGMSDTADRALRLAFAEEIAAGAGRDLMASKLGAVQALGALAISMGHASGASTELAIHEGFLKEVDIDLGGSKRDAAQSIMNLAFFMNAASHEATNLAFAEMTVNAATNASSNAVANNARRWGGWLALTRTTIHWLISGTAEFLAVAIPAAVAAGVGAFVLYQGLVEGVGRHLQSLYTVTEAVGGAFGKTAGDVLGLGHAFQTAQNAANPGAYELLGAYINIARSHMVDFASAGLQVVHVLDEFAARVTVDLKGTLGGQIQNLLANMVPDLQKLGQVFGNLGHSILNLASAMPGLAEVLLTVFAGLTKVLTVLTNPAWYNFGGNLFTVAMGFEEFYRWGGLVGNILVRITRQMGYFNSLNTAGFISRFGGYLLTMVRAGGLFIAWIGRALVYLADLNIAFGAVGLMATRAGAGIVAFAESLTPLEAAGMAAPIAGTLALMYAMDKYRDSALQTIDATNKAIDSATSAGGAFAAIARGLSTTSVELQRQQHILSGYNQVAQNVGTVVGRQVAALQHFNGALGGAASGLVHANNSSNIFVKGATTLGEVLMGPIGMGLAFLTHGAADAGTKINELTAAQHKWISEAGNMMINAANLGHALHVTSGEAFLLADAAGVKLTQSMKVGSEGFRIAVQQVLNLEQGYKAMAANSTALGNDVRAVGIQAGLQATKVQQLTQAWDAYMGLLTGGTSTLASFEQSITNLTSGTNRITTILGKSGSLTLSVKGFAESLRSFTGQGAQAWQNFNQVVSGGAQQFIDWMNNAAAVGMVKGSQLDGAIKGVVAQLLPLASKSQTARAEISGLAQEAGGPATTNLKALERWARQGGMSAKQLGDFVSKTTAKLSNMAQVAANLGSVLQSQLANAFDQARMNSSGLTGDLASLSTAIANTGVKSSTTHGDVVKVINDMASLHVSVPTIAALISSLGVNISESGVKAIEAAGGYNALSGKIGQVTMGVHDLGVALSSLHDKTVHVNVVFSQTGSPPAAYYPGGGSAGHAVGPGGRASGGPVTAGVPYTVGEAGRELFIPQVPGYVMPHQESGRFVSSPRAAAGALSSPQLIEVHSHLHLDGKQIFEDVKVHDLQYGTRNAGRRTGLLRPGT